MPMRADVRQHAKEDGAPNVHSKKLGLFNLLSQL